MGNPTNNVMLLMIFEKLSHIVQRDILILGKKRVQQVMQMIRLPIGQ